MYRNSCTDPGCLAFTHVRRCVIVACEVRVHYDYGKLNNMQCFAILVEPRKYVLSCTDRG